MKKIFILLVISSFSLSSIAQERPKPEESEVWEPEPAVVTPGTWREAPSDAIILFDGKDLSEWKTPQFKGEPIDIPATRKMLAEWDSNFDYRAAEWSIIDGEMVVAPGKGSIETRRVFGDVQLHIEWLAPVDPGKESQGYSNSGVFFMDMYEVQVLNSYNNRTYANGQASSVYKQHIPLVNASRKPGTWQWYDIVFTAPRFKEDGSLESPARLTVFHNGVLVQNNVELKGPTVYIGKPEYVAHPDKLPIRLQDHGNLVRFRNIWVREL